MNIETPMNLKTILKLLPIGLVIVGGLSLLFLLLMEGRSAHVSLRVPIAENNAKPSENAASFAGELTTSDGKPSTLQGAWPGFRGPNLNSIVTVDLSKPLNQKWDVQPPKALWDIKVGEGYAGAAVSNGLPRCRRTYPYSHMEPS